jgi:hypothetical protein
LKDKDNDDDDHHHHISVMELGHLLIRSGLTCPEVSTKVCHDSFCQSGSSFSLPWVVYYEAFYLHFVSSFSCIPVICTKLELFLTPLQFVYLFCDLSSCILQDNDLDTNNMNKSARKLHNYKHLVVVSRVDTAACSDLLVVTKDLVRLSTSFR